MDRKRYICYLILISIPVVFLLLLLVIFGQLPLMLILVLLLIVGLGILNRKMPEIFAPLRGTTTIIPTDPAPQTEPGSHGDKHRTFLTLSSINAYSSSCITVNQPVFVIGRARDCHHIIGDGAVSSHHLTIEYDYDDKRCYVTDNDTTNGTYLNSIRLNPYARCALKDGDILQLAGNAYTVEYVHF